jgi:hypothetical protein
MESIFKNKVALTLVIFSVLAVTILGIVSMIFASKFENTQEGFSALQYVVGAFLPIFGTWMGTILAYYFTKENFESANQNTQALVRHITTSAQKLASLKATEKMIYLSAIAYEEWDDATTINKKIADVLKAYETKKVNRLPFMTKDKILKYIIHKSVFDSFLVKETGQPDANIANITLNDFFTKVKKNYPDLQSYIDNGAGFISIEGNLSDAQAIMEKNKNCQDVFVTNTGNKNEQIIGWITNRIIEENARI